MLASIQAVQGVAQFQHCRGDCGYREWNLTNMLAPPLHCCYALLVSSFSLFFLSDSLSLSLFLSLSLSFSGINKARFSAAWPFCGTQHTSSSTGCSAYDISCPDISDKALLSAGKNNYIVDMEAVLTKDFLAHVQYGRILEQDLCVILFVFQSLWRLRSSTSPGNPSSYDDLNVVWVSLLIFFKRSNSCRCLLCAVRCRFIFFLSTTFRMIGLIFGLILCFSLCFWESQLASGSFLLSTVNV